MTTLREELIKSQTNPFLLEGMPAPDEGWIYRDFFPMPTNIWIELIDLLDIENIRICAANSTQLPPAKRCRAQIWISPEAQKRWKDYLDKTSN